MLDDKETGTAVAESRGLDPDRALSRYFRDREWLFKTALGGVFYASSMLLFLFPLAIPLSVSLWALNTGYILRVMRVKIRDQSARLPDWSDVPDLFISGMSWIAIATGFLLLTCTQIMTALIIGVALSSIQAVGPFFIYYALATIIGISAITLLQHFFTCVLMANFAEKETMTAGFEFSTVLARIKEEPGDFLCAWLIGLGLVLLALVVPVLTLVGIFFIPSTLFCAQLLGAVLMAQAWARGEKIEERELSEPPQS
ncbi:MAG: DUF4013 domain-containing protein [Candidatus Melainabacteria bacterium]|nr:DUF4013 domain-containing protein [Candidatus Melainabacteria bacterium]